MFEAPYTTSSYEKTQSEVIIDTEPSPVSTPRADPAPAAGSSSTLEPGSSAGTRSLPPIDTDDGAPGQGKSAAPTALSTGAPASGSNTTVPVSTPDVASSINASPSPTGGGMPRAAAHGPPATAGGSSAAAARAPGSPSSASQGRMPKPAAAAAPPPRSAPMPAATSNPTTPVATTLKPLAWPGSTGGGPAPSPAGGPSPHGVPSPAGRASPVGAAAAAAVGTMKRRGPAPSPSVQKEQATLTNQSRLVLKGLLGSELSCSVLYVLCAMLMNATVETPQLVVSEMDVQRGQEWEEGVVKARVGGANDGRPMNYEGTVKVMQRVLEMHKPNIYNLNLYLTGPQAADGGTRGAGHWHAPQGGACKRVQQRWVAVAKTGCWKSGFGGLCCHTFCCRCPPSCAQSLGQSLSLTATLQLGRPP